MRRVDAAPVHVLRPGQAEALKRWAAALEQGATSELIVVPVGYGKTVIGAGSFGVAAQHLNADTCLYLTPTDVLRRQVYRGFENAVRMAGAQVPVRKILADNATAGRIAATNANIVVATYQQLAAAPRLYEQLCARRRVHVVCDEAHHLGESGRWAAAVGGLRPVSQLLLSATPVRLDRDAIAGARYVKDELGYWLVDPLLEVSMRQAWKEKRILKHLHLQMKDYAVEMADAEGEVYTFTASEMAELPDFDQRCVRQQLRWNEDYVEPLVREFASALITKQRMAPGQHQGLVFAATTEHANHLYRVFSHHHPSLRCTVVHSGEIGDAENERRMAGFHDGEYDVLIQVKKASEGFDAPTVSVLLKLDAVHSREPVVQQLGRGLRYNHNLPEEQNILNVYVGRDPRMQAIVDFLERELPRAGALRSTGPDEAAPVLVPVEDEDEEYDEDEEEEPATPEIRQVTEAGDAYVDHTGRFIEGQQLTMFGVAAPPPVQPVKEPEFEVVDIDGELNEAIRFCTEWTNRAARERARRMGYGVNHHQHLNGLYGQLTGKRGRLSTPEEYRAKGEWMKARYLEFLR